jgi:putative hemolysin
MEYENLSYKNMKTPLSYQVTEYDCGQATLLNAIRYLFKRGEIPPIIIKYITQFTLDTVGENGQIGVCGTSTHAIEYLANWINNSKASINLNLHAKILNKDDVNINNIELNECIKNGGVAIFRVWADCEHYVLCTNIDDKIFDPYYLNKCEYDDDPDCIMIDDRPFEYNRIVNKKRFNENTKNDYSFVKNEESRILLLYKK